MMSVEVTVVPQCRVGLAPTELDGPPWRPQAAVGITVARLAPWVAMTGSQARPVVTTACSCRRIAAAMTAWAWVTVSLFCSLVVRWVNRVSHPGDLGGRVTWRRLAPGW